MPATSATETAEDAVYLAIRARVIAYEFAQGKRIIMARLADELGVSTWPIRDAMKRLAAEGLVIKAPHKGFIAMSLTGDRVLEQYELTRLYLSQSAKRIDTVAHPRLSEYEPLATVLNGLKRRTLSDAKALAIYTSEVFCQLALLTGSSELARAIERTNDHLYYIRTLECRHLNSVQTELICFCQLVLARQCEELVSLINDYHDQRIALLPMLLR